jgi:hypothetical protein
MKFNEDAFKQFYLASKWFGKLDREIASELFVSSDTLYRMKKQVGLTNLKRKRIKKNRQGLSEEQLRTADKNGIGRRNALRRRRLYGWTKVDAISVPLRPKKVFR